MPTERENSTTKGTTLLVAALLAVVAIGAWAFSRGETPRRPLPDGTSVDADTDGIDDTAPTVTTSLPLLAEAGFIVRRTDDVPGSVLTLALGHPDGRARICTVGRELEGDAPLDVARCRAGTPEELEVTPRREPTEDHDIGGGTFARLARGAGDAPDRLIVRGVGGAGAPAPAEVVVGDVPARSERVRACRSRGGLVIAVEGELVHGARETAMALFDGTSWSDAVRGPSQIFETAFTCRDGEGAYTWIESDAGLALVHQLRCRATGCEAGRTRVTLAGADPMAADLAGDVLLVWATEDNTRARLAPLAEIGRSGDLGALHEPGLRVLSRGLFVRGGVAVVTLRTPTGLHAVRIDTTRRIAPLSVEEE